MKISSYTQILVLVCLGAALVAFLLLKTQFDQYEQASDYQQTMQISQNDMNVSQTMLQQWFTTIDLYYTDHQTYLARGIASQSEQILKRLSRIEKTVKETDPVRQLQQRISSETLNIEKIAFNHNKDKIPWNELLKNSDKNTQKISRLFESLKREIDTHHDNARAETTRQRERLKLHATLLLGCYIITVIGAAYQTSRTIIQPLEKLTKLGDNNPTIDPEDAFTLKRGPKEIIMLAKSFQQLYKQIATKMEEALQSQAAERNVQQRLSELVNNVSLAIITVETDGIITSFNPATMELFKLNEEQLNNRQITELIPNLNIGGGLFNQILNTGIDIELDAVIGKSVKPVELSCAEFNYQLDCQSENSNIRQYTIILHDISTRKWNEDRVRKLNQKLINTSRQAGIAEIATSILHSVGNVLNSVNTSVSLLQQNIAKEQTEGIKKTAQMFDQYGAELFAPGGKGPQLIEYLNALASQLEQNSSKNLKEVASLKHNVLHIAEIVSAQQKFSGKSGIIEQLKVNELIEEALNINVVSLENNKVEINRLYDVPLPINGDRSKIIQILVNLIRNANEAMLEQKSAKACITIEGYIDNDLLTVKISDTGSGIEKANMTHMFRYGFTTKQDGHGFGLHSCALAAKEMYGTLTAHSEGKGKGAQFELCLPTDPAHRESEQIKALMATPLKDSPLQEKQHE